VIYRVDDAATFKQCEAARVLIDSGKRLMVCKTVVLELEWVLRGRYALAQGFDFADAQHHASYRSCTSVATFDDKGFARRAKRTGLKPDVVVP
jgi:hypothetical protein